MNSRRRASFFETSSDDEPRPAKALGSSVSPPISPFFGQPSDQQPQVPPLRVPQPPLSEDAEGWNLRKAVLSSPGSPGSNSSSEDSASNSDAEGSDGDPDLLNKSGVSESQATKLRQRRSDATEPTGSPPAAPPQQRRRASATGEATKVTPKKGVPQAVTPQASPARSTISRRTNNAVPKMSPTPKAGRRSLIIGAASAASSSSEEARRRSSLSSWSTTQGGEDAPPVIERAHSLDGVVSSPTKAKIPASPGRATHIPTTEELSDSRMEETALLRFEDLEFHQIDKTVFKEKLLQEFRGHGVHNSAIERLRIQLREGSVVAEVTSDAQTMKQLMDTIIDKTIKVMGSMATVVEGGGIVPVTVIAALRKQVARLEHMNAELTSEASNTKRELDVMKQKQVEWQEKIGEKEEEVEKQEQSWSHEQLKLQMKFDAERSEWDSARAQLELELHELRERVPMQREDERAALQRKVLEQVNLSRTLLQRQGQELVRCSEELASENTELEKKVQRLTEELHSEHLNVEEARSELLKCRAEAEQQHAAYAARRRQQEESLRAQVEAEVGAGAEEAFAESSRLVEELRSELIAQKASSMECSISKDLGLELRSAFSELASACRVPEPRASSLGERMRNWQAERGGLERMLTAKGAAAAVASGCWRQPQHSVCASTATASVASSTPAGHPETPTRSIDPPLISQATTVSVANRDATQLADACSIERSARDLDRTPVTPVELRREPIGAISFGSSRDAATIEAWERGMERREAVRYVRTRVAMIAADVEARQQMLERPSPRSIGSATPQRRLGNANAFNCRFAASPDSGTPATNGTGAEVDGPLARFGSPTLLSAGDARLHSEAKPFSPAELLPSSNGDAAIPRRHFSEPGRQAAQAVDAMMRQVRGVAEVRRANAHWASSSSGADGKGLAPQLKAVRALERQTSRLEHANLEWASLLVERGRASHEWAARLGAGASSSSVASPCGAVAGGSGNDTLGESVDSAALTNALESMTFRLERLGFKLNHVNDSEPAVCH